MKKTAEQKKVPELRFPEFAGEWEESRLGSLLSFKNGLNAPKEAYGSGYKFINVLDIINNAFITHDSIIGSVEVSSKEFDKNIVEYGDVLFQRSSETREEVGQANVYLDPEQPATFGGFVIRGKRIAEYDPVFMNLLLKTSVVRKEITSRSGGSTRYNIGQESISGVEVRLPAETEQSKIASFLSSIDRRIEGLEKKRDLLKEYKKGLMQKLFNQSLRFGNGTNPFPEWEQRSFASLYNFESTNSYSRDMLNYEHGSVKNVHYGDIHTKFKAQFSIEEEQVPFVDPSVDLSRIRDGQYLQEGDLVIADASEDYVDIGKAIEIVSLNGEKAIAGLHTILARRKTADELAVGFAAYLMQSEEMRLSIKRVAQGTKVLGLSPKRLGEIKMRLPHFEEQRKIADFLSALDRKIEQVETQVARTRKFKQGLLQKIFV